MSRGELNIRQKDISHRNVDVLFVCFGFFNVEKVNRSVARDIFADIVATVVFVSKYENVGMWKVGLGSCSTAEFLAKARNIVTQHRELQNQVEALHSQISQLETAQFQAVNLIFCLFRRVL